MHEVYRRWSRVLADHPGDRVRRRRGWGPAWVGEPYQRPDELAQAFAMDVVFTELDATALRKVSTTTTCSR